MLLKMTVAGLVLSAAPSRWIRSSPAIAMVHSLAPAPPRNVAHRRRPRRKNGINSSFPSSRHRPRSSLGSTVEAETEATAEALRRKKSLASGREKRKKLIGLAKAVDRGQYPHVYRPGGTDGTRFAARSGLPAPGRPFCVLGIESSCDDTGAAVVRSDGTILGEALASQHAIHEEWGGVVPGLAKTAHEENIDRVVRTALANADMTMEDVDAVGVTVGPGLEICLRVGCNRGRELAMEHGKPFVGVHHLEAHILMARIPPERYGDDDDNDDGERSPGATRPAERAMEFPFLALLVSGGHCQILKCLGVGRYAVVGGTLDDSLGEAFDKTARLLGLPVGGGGGPAVEALAADGDPGALGLPVPLAKRRDCDFSYAGLKTATRLAAERLCAERGVATAEDLPRGDKADVAASFQHTAFRHAEVRLGRAMAAAEKEGIRTLAVVGGVAANRELRRRLEGLCKDRREPWEMFVPPPRLCTDQGAMSAWAAVERLAVGSSDDPGGQEVFARYPFASYSDDGAG